tara:strand:+ start:1283 stop:1921 length:639 start_codon:yes stop_codon:yes gene_type:complete
VIKLKDLLNEDRTASIVQQAEREIQQIRDKYPAGTNKTSMDYKDETAIDELENKIAYAQSKQESVNEDVSPKGWNMSKKYIKFIEREVKNLKKYHNQQNEEDFLEVANYIELQLKQMKKDLNESVNQKTLMKEGVDLYSHIKLVEQHLADFRKDIDRKRGGSYESDSVEYETDRWENNSKMLKGRDKKLGQWEKKVKKTLDSLIKDYQKAWK